MNNGIISKNKKQYYSLDSYHDCTNRSSHIQPFYKPIFKFYSSYSYQYYTSDSYQQQQQHIAHQIHTSITLHVHTKSAQRKKKIKSFEQ